MTAGFMASVTCGLTAEDWDQLGNPTLISSMGLLLDVSNPSSRASTARPSVHTTVYTTEHGPIPVI